MAQCVPGVYYTESQLSHEYVGDGTAQNFWMDDSYFTYALPLIFPIWRNHSSRTDIYISSNGYVDLSPYSDMGTSWILSLNWQQINGLPLLDRLVTYGGAQAGEDVYITENTDNLVIRWVAETWNYDNRAPVNVELVLFKTVVLNSL